MLKLEVSGRYRYYRIAAADIAMAIEALTNLAQTSAPLREQAEAHQEAPRLYRSRCVTPEPATRPSGGRTCRTAV
ncbi:MAG: hypothetical protein CBCREVIR_3324 [Candidatus Burkholderia crenata]|nr:MAG: hypothetical protein CBCREVIR_3324 [Candidatus Burkholderia crenata]